jgi:YHS domain-containing protein
MYKLVVSMLLVGLVACSRGGDPRQENPVPAAAAAPAGFSRVTDRSQVCMVNDLFMGRSQIPVVVEGRTYYGCCPDCKEKLEKQPAVRTAQDPVTGEEVDKARAVIVQDGSGKVLYFANEDTLRRYRS